MARLTTTATRPDTTVQTPEEDEGLKRKGTEDVLDKEDVLSDPVQEVVRDSLTDEDGTPPETSETTATATSEDGDTTTSEDTIAANSEEPETATDRERVTSAASRLKKALDEDKDTDTATA